jgi:hypothetical protein
MSTFWQPVAYGLLNIVSASGIVFANKVTKPFKVGRLLYASNFAEARYSNDSKD